MDLWIGGLMGQERRGKRRKKVPCPDHAPSLVPAIAFVLLPMPTRSRTPIQQTLYAVPQRSPERRPSRIIRRVRHGLARKTSFLCRFTRVASSTWAHKKQFISSARARGAIPP
jgi:hypothetical protein